MSSQQAISSQLAVTWADGEAFYEPATALLEELEPLEPSCTVTLVRSERDKSEPLSESDPHLPAVQSSAGVEQRESQVAESAPEKAAVERETSKPPSPDELRLLRQQSGLTAADLRAKEELVREGLRNLEEDEGWELCSKEPFRLLYRKLKGSPFQSVKVSAVFPAPVEQLLAMAVEYDLTCTWHQYIKESRIMSSSRKPWTQLMYGCLWTPLVLFTSTFYCQGFDLSEERGCVLITIEDGTGMPLPPGVKPPQKRRLSHAGAFGSGSCVVMEPLPPSADGRPRTRAALVAHVDPRSSFVPHRLVQFILGIVAPYAYKAVLAVLEEVFRDPESALNQRLAASPHLYERCRQRCAEVVARKLAEAEE